MYVLKSLKAINERIAVYERQGLTDSAYYQDLINAAQLSGLETRITKDGFIRLSTSKKAVESAKIESVNKILEMPSLKQERAQVRKKGYKTRKEQDERIVNYGRLKKWAEENLDELYIDARSGVDFARELESWFDDDGMRTHEYSEIFELISKYEFAKSLQNKLLEESDYFT